MTSATWPFTVGYLRLRSVDYQGHEGSQARRTRSSLREAVQAHDES